MVLQTIAHAAGVFQVDPQHIAQALESMRAKPELELNDRRYYRTADIREAITRTPGFSSGSQVNIFPR